MKKWTIRVPDGVASAVEVLASLRGVSINQFVVDMLAEEAAEARDDPRTKARVQAEIDLLRRQFGL